MIVRPLMSRLRGLMFQAPLVDIRLTTSQNGLLTIIARTPPHMPQHANRMLTSSLSPATVAISDASLMLPCIDPRPPAEQHAQCSPADVPHCLHVFRPFLPRACARAKLPRRADNALHRLVLLVSSP